MCLFSFWCLRRPYTIYAKNYFSVYDRNVQQKKYHNQSKPCWLLIELHRMWPFCDWPKQFWQKIWGKPIRPSFMLAKKKSGEIPSWTLFLFRYRIKASWVTSMSSNSSVHSFHSIFILQWLQKLYESLNVVYVFTVPTTHYFELTLAVLIVLITYFGWK